MVQQKDIIMMNGNTVSHPIPDNEIEILLSMIYNTRVLFVVIVFCGLFDKCYSQGMIDQYSNQINQENLIRNSCLAMTSQIQYDGILGFLKVDNNRVYRKEVANNGKCFWNDNGPLNEEIVTNRYSSYSEINVPSEQKIKKWKELESQQKVLWRIEGNHLCKFSQGRGFENGVNPFPWTPVTKSCAQRLSR